MIDFNCSQPQPQPVLLFLSTLDRTQNGHRRHEERLFQDSKQCSPFKIKKIFTANGRFHDTYFILDNICHCFRNSG